MPIIVAINKIDKPDANPERVSTELLSHEIVVESLGGDTLEVEVSAPKKHRSRQAARGHRCFRPRCWNSPPIPTARRDGIVVEAQLDAGRGPGGHGAGPARHPAPRRLIVAGTAWGRVRALLDDRGEQVK